MGEWNMANDLAIAEEIGNSNSPTTIKVYGWSIPTLSLGKHQKESSIDKEFLKTHKFGLVRRPTGGRAVFHNKEITYLFAISSKDKRLPKNVIQSYMKISDGLTMTLKSLGVNCDVQKNKKKAISRDICYDSPSLYEVTINGKKLIGSAQYRNEKFVLQHGSIPNKFDYRNYVDSFKIKNKKQMISHLENNVTDIQEYLGRSISYEEFADEVKNSFSKVFDEEVEYGEITEKEIKLTKKYLENFKIEL
jgi:lipoate-protein ligase A